MNCYNSDRFLREAIDSVYAQSYTSWEIVFWDNSSTDQSASIAKSYDGKLKYFCSDETTSLGEARNRALSKVSGKYITFLDCDDCYLPDKLEKQVLLMEESEYAMCYSSVIHVGEYGDEIRRKEVVNSSGFMLGELLKHYEISMVSAMVRGSILLSDNLNFETSLRYSPDYDLFMTIASRHPIGVLKDFLVKYRIVQNSLSRRCIDIVAEENEFTLDKILYNDQFIYKKYRVEFVGAYKKLHYYNAVAAIYKGDMKKARSEIRVIRAYRVEYMILYVLLLFPIPSQFLLKILGRPI